jgi:uncharacterized protein with HEPN domain
MPRSELPARVEDIVQAGVLVETFLHGVTFEQYAQSPLIRSGVERQLMIIGESVARIRDVDRPAAERLGPVESIVGFRNILVHGYYMVSHDVVWNIAVNEAPRIVRAARELLAELDEP